MLLFLSISYFRWATILAFGLKFSDDPSCKHWRLNLKPIKFTECTSLSHFGKSIITWLTVNTSTTLTFYRFFGNFFALTAFHIVFDWNFHIYFVLGIKYKRLICQIQLSAFYLVYFFFDNKYLANTTMDPSEVQISSKIVLLIGSLVIWKMASSLKEFLLSFYKK